MQICHPKSGKQELGPLLVNKSVYAALHDSKNNHWEEIRRLVRRVTETTYPVDAPGHAKPLWLLDAQPHNARKLQKQLQSV
jgi:hypothetical protein